MVCAHSLGRIILLKSPTQKPHTIQPVLSGRNTLFPVLLVHVPRGNLGTSRLRTPVRKGLEMPKMYTAHRPYCMSLVYRSGIMSPEGIFVMGSPFSYAGVLTTRMLSKQCACLCPWFSFWTEVVPPSSDLNAQESAWMGFRLWVLLTQCNLITAKPKFSLTFAWSGSQSSLLGIENFLVGFRLLPILSVGSFGSQCSTVNCLWDLSA